MADMRMVQLIIAATLGIAVVAEGAYIIRTRHQVDVLTQKLESLSQGSEGEGPIFARAGRSEDGGGDLPSFNQPSRRSEPGRAPPPRLIVVPGQPGAPAAANSGDPLPLPPALDSAETREQLRQFVLAAVDRERQEARDKQDQRRQEREKERRAEMAKELGLSGSEADKFNEILNSAQAAREQMRERIESGQVNRQALGQEFAAMRTKTEEQMRGLLGDERMKKFQDMRRRDGGGPGGGRFGGPGGPGGPGGGFFGRRPGGAGGPEGGGPEGPARAAPAQ